MKQEELRRCLLVFLDANIDVLVALHLFDLRVYARWISLGSARLRFSGVSRKKNATQLTKRQILRIKNFFDMPLGQNMLEANGVPPYKMDDCALLSYMVALIKKCPDNNPALFYTKDKKFLRQKKIRNHPDLRFFDEGRIVYIPLAAPPQDKKGSAVIARYIRHDIEKRLGVECCCKRIPS